jgi:phi LC3 family holin
VITAQKGGKRKMINWTLRLKNKTTLVSLVGLTVGFVYQVLNTFDVVPSIPQDTVIQFFKYLIYILVGLGIVVDPTTVGIRDSERALVRNVPGGTYAEPNVIDDAEDTNKAVALKAEKPKDGYIPSDEDALVEATK